MRERLLILGALGLGLSLLPVPRVSARSAPLESQSQAPAKDDGQGSSNSSAKKNAAEDKADAGPKVVSKSRSKTASKAKAKVPAKPDSKTASRTKNESSAKRGDRKGSLSMSPAVVCRSIDGYEQYEPLPEAAQTSEEKLLVYFRPLGFKIQPAGKSFEAHVIPDFEIRKRGEKRILLQKKKIMDYHPVAAEPPRFIYLKSLISLKGLKPGDYDLTIILHDELAKEEDPATQVIPFRVNPTTDPRQSTTKTDLKTP